jgi:hypothetical protein
MSWLRVVRWAGGGGLGGSRGSIVFMLYGRMGHWTVQ